MKILVIGQCVLDTIIENNAVKIQPGGIYYSVSGFNSSRADADQIFLLTKIDEPNYKYFIEQFSQITLVNNFCEEKIPYVKLIIHKELEREEHYENFNSSLDISNIFNQVEYDGIFINMITGSDILLEDLQKIRQSYKGMIFCDIHTLARGVNSKGERIFRQIPDASSWLSNMDIVQVNENEIKTICNAVNEETTAEFVLQNGVKIFLVTKGRNGVTCYFNLSGKKGKVSLEALKVESNNSVGCGDIFGAVFFYSYIYKMDLQKSLQKAVFAASETAKIKNIKELTRLKDVIYRKYFKEQDIDNRL